LALSDLSVGGYRNLESARVIYPAGGTNARTIQATYNETKTTLSGRAAASSGGGIALDRSSPNRCAIVT
jgi:hypothetical protein